MAADSKLKEARNLIETYIGSTFYDLYYNYDGTGTTTPGAPFNGGFPGSDIRIRKKNGNVSGIDDRFIFNIGCLEKRGKLEQKTNKPVEPWYNFPMEWACVWYSYSFPAYCHCTCDNPGYQNYLDGNSPTDNANFEIVLDGSDPIGITAQCGPDGGAPEARLDWSNTYCYYECQNACFQMNNNAHFQPSNDDLVWDPNCSTQDWKIHGYIQLLMQPPSRYVDWEDPNDYINKAYVVYPYINKVWFNSGTDSNPNWDLISTDSLGNKYENFIKISDIEACVTETDEGYPDFCSNYLRTQGLLPYDPENISDNSPAEYHGNTWIEPAPPAQTCCDYSPLYCECTWDGVTPLDINNNDCCPCVDNYPPDNPPIPGVDPCCGYQLDPACVQPTENDAGTTGRMSLAEHRELCLSCINCWWEDYWTAGNCVYGALDCGMPFGIGSDCDLDFVWSSGSDWDNSYYVYEMMGYDIEDELTIDIGDIFMPGFGEGFAPTFEGSANPSVPITEGTSCRCETPGTFNLPDGTSGEYISGGECNQNCLCQGYNQSCDHNWINPDTGTRFGNGCGYCRSDADCVDSTNCWNGEINGDPWQAWTLWG